MPDDISSLRSRIERLERLTRGMELTTRKFNELSALFPGKRATTGDPKGLEGMLYVNTADNTVRIYAEGAWRTVISWQQIDNTGIASGESFGTATVATA